MGRENSFQSCALRYLNQLPGCRAENVSGNAAQSGRADINGCYKGRSFRIELKSPDNRNEASDKQSLNLRRWMVRSSCVVAILYSMKSLKYLFEEESHWFDHIRSYEKYTTEKNGCTSWYCIPALHQEW